MSVGASCQLVDDADVAFSRLTADEVRAFVWHAAGLEHRAVGRWGCGWRAADVMAWEDVGMLTYGVAVARAGDRQQGGTREALNRALLRLQRENFFDTMHDK